MNFSINPEDESRYYQVGEMCFDRDDVGAVFEELVVDLDEEAVRVFLVKNWPLEYGEGVNLMIREGYEPEGMSSEDREALQGLYNDELFYELCEYPITTYSYFTDMFDHESPETEAMLEAVAQFANDHSSDGCKRE